MRLRWTFAAAAAVVLGGASAAGWVAARALDRRLGEAVVRAAADRGLLVQTVDLSGLGPLRLGGLALRTAGGERIAIDEARVGWRLSGGGDVRAHVREIGLRGLRVEHGALALAWPAIDADVLSWDGGGGNEHLRLRQRPAGGGVDVRWQTVAGGGEAEVALEALDLASARVSWGGEAVLAPGTWGGRLRLAYASGRVATAGALSADALRLALPRSIGLGSGEYGAATHAELAWEVVRDGASLDVRSASARLGGLVLEGHGRLDGALAERPLEMELSARTDLGAAFRTAAVRLPDALAVGAADPLGTASFDLAVRGPLARPALLRIVPHLRYDGTPQATEKLWFLRRAFRYRPADSEGVTLDVREGAPDFIPLAAVPPLVVRAVLVSEDAGFWGHPGVDVAEIPVAWAANRERGGSARGASTITQQLVKNLFLSKDKSYGRKIEEAALALLVDAAVPKARILEIYLNVIEWGPDLYGLVPAARHYFGKAPAELSPKEVAFLVCLIPSPVRYHQAYAAGHVGPGMEQLMANLLAKLRSVGAISDDDYARALEEELRFRPQAQAPEPVGSTGSD